MYIKWFPITIFLLTACAGRSPVKYDNIGRLIEIREYNDAIDQLTEISPGDTLLGKLYILAGRYEEAFSRELSPYQLAWVYQKLGMFGDAIRSYRNVDDILYENAMYNSGICAGEMGGTASSIVYFEKAGNFRDARKRLAASYEAEQKYIEALSIWEDIGDAEALYHMAEIYELVEESGESLYKELLKKYPQSSFALKALGKVTVPRVTMANVLYKNKKYGEALKYTPKKAHGMRASCYKGMRRYKNAAKEYKRLNDHLNTGRCLEKAGASDAALEEYLSSRSDEGYFRAGILYENMGRYGDAIDAYDEVGPSLKEMANLRSGILCLDEGKVEEAKKRFEHTFPVPGNYWLAKITGLPSYRSYVLSKSSFSYYVHLLDGKLQVSNISSEEWIVSFCDTVYSLSHEDSTRLLKGKLLLKYGIIEEAGEELSAIGENNPLFRYRLALLAHEGGLDNLALYLTKKIIDKGHPPFPYKILTLAYPLSFLPTVLKYEVENSFLFMALIKQESNFYPGAVSSSNAIGLTQVIPSTGSGIARELGVDNFCPESLKDPETSIRFGAHYFNYCLKRFDGVPEYALAAYNGGPTRTAKWKRDCPVDEWVERIPLLQTRLYVKKIMGFYHVYRQLYGDTLRLVEKN
ncbi:hypothetical protein CH333_09810 [candidate division WOR-3 bacterium JGI_Cruoil_03_44_89]|uniref:Transglycosylase SLT domain-containing protein n=1 Tax=candidate division WOR-3 bacterium JGI_Cruoil_03_44_89 TaxID=1973748 RepID=A0A235BMZ1_UNCW3|nr:MAG: hypothetical protein CH333_09810 [candidate division WOR-3 bacterium JGI_Cruoil_03_44_89]